MSFEFATANKIIFGAGTALQIGKQHAGEPHSIRKGSAAGHFTASPVNAIAILPTSCSFYQFSDPISYTVQSYRSHSGLI